jgi:ammonia channel protein AmtB
MIEFYSTKTTGKDAVSDVSIGGLLYTHDATQLWKQALGAAFIFVWNIIATTILLKLISFVVPLRASDGDVEGGDLAIHGIDPVPYPVPTV